MCAVILRFQEKITEDKDLKYCLTGGVSMEGVEYGGSCREAKKKREGGL